MYGGINQVPLAYVCITQGTLYYVRIYMGPFVTNNPRELYDYIRAEYRQIAIIVGSTTIGRVGMLSV